MGDRFIGWQGRDTTRMPSDSIWGDCPWDSIKAGFRLGAVFEDNFMSFNITQPTTEGNWTAENGYSGFSSSGGTLVNDTAELGGAILLGSNDDGEAASIRTTSTPFKISQSNLNFWFEAMIDVSTIADSSVCFFLGLMEDTPLTVAVPLVDSSPYVLADKKLVGFFKNETSLKGAFASTVYKQTSVTAVTVQADAVTLVAATYTKLGMKFIPLRDKKGNYALKFYQDGVELANAKLIPSATTDFPNNGNLGLVLSANMAAGSSVGTVGIDWWRAAQLYG